MRSGGVGRWPPPGRRSAPALVALVARPRRHSRSSPGTLDPRPWHALHGGGAGATRRRRSAGDLWFNVNDRRADALRRQDAGPSRQASADFDLRADPRRGTAVRRPLCREHRAGRWPAQGSRRRGARRRRSSPSPAADAAGDDADALGRGAELRPRLQPRFVPAADQGQGVHTRREGSTRAIACSIACLSLDPSNLRARWLLNIAHMTLGTYPDGVPPAS